MFGKPSAQTSLYKVTFTSAVVGTERESILHPVSHGFYTIFKLKIFFPKLENL